MNFMAFSFVMDRQPVLTTRRTTFTRIDNRQESFRGRLP